MQLKTLVIKQGDGTIIREIIFGTGLNLIVDETLPNNQKATGNNVGKTTVLKLIDYCFGGKKQIIWQDGENKGHEIKEVKDFLVEKDVYVVLTIVSGGTEHVLERNFRSNRDSVLRVDGKKVKMSEYDSVLTKMILPNHLNSKPSFRQIIAHNIRYEDERVSNTLKFLSEFATKSEYEALFLYMLGLEYEETDDKQEIERELNDEVKYCKKLEQGHTLNEYKTMLSFTESEIHNLQKQKELLGLNENFENDLQSLNQVKAEIGRISTELTRLNLKVQLINESIASLETSMISIDTNAVRYLYQEVMANVSGITTSFEKLIQYHNHMAQHKKEYVGAELPQINQRIQELRDKLDDLLVQEDELSRRIAKGNSLEELEKIISLLQVHSSKRGEYEALIDQIAQSQKTIKEYEDRLKNIHDHLYSEEYQARLQERIDSFNVFFQSVSNELYGEAYSLSFRLSEDKNGKRSYEFNAFNANSSSGKKTRRSTLF